MTIATVTFDPQCNPIWVSGTAYGQDAYTMTIPYGKPKRIVVSSVNDDDAIVSASVSGATITFKCTDAAGSAIAVDFYMDFIVFLDTG